MYAVLDRNLKMIAWHDDKEVCEKYLENLKTTYKDKDEYKDYIIVKIKKKYRFKTGVEQEGLYLVRYGSTYIQKDYIECMDIEMETFLHDEKYAIDVMYRTLELSDLNSKDYKTIVKAIRVMESIYEEDKRYTPNISHLQEVYNEFEPYLKMEEDDR